MLVSSPKFTAKEKPKGLMRNGDKNGLDSGSVRIMWKTYNFTKNNVQV